MLVSRIVREWSPGQDTGNPPSRQPSPGAERRQAHKALLSSPDEVALARLRAAGSDMASPQPVEHFLYVPNARAAKDLARVLKDEGYDVSSGRSNAGSGSLVRARHLLVPEAERLLEVRLHLERLADARNGEYDGWQVSVVTQTH
jgi:Regulator of ribonuclease activity B